MSPARSRESGDAAALPAPKVTSNRGLPAPGDAKATKSKGRGGFAGGGFGGGGGMGGGLGGGGGVSGMTGGASGGEGMRRGSDVRFKQAKDDGEPREQLEPDRAKAVVNRRRR